MGAAYFIVLERPIDGLDTGMDGKSMTRHLASLDEAARQAGVRPLSEFFSASPADALEFMEGEGVDPGDIELPPLQNFPARDGLATVKALLPHPVAQADGVARDLRDCERILEVAERNGVGWHFEIDF